MSKRINYYSKKLAKTDKSPEECTNAEIKAIIDTYTDYLNAMCDEDGWVVTYERVSEKVSIYYEEAEGRGIK